MSTGIAALEPRAAALVARMKAAGLTLATAESCTGGLIAGLVTEVPGSSAVLDRGFVTYSNAAKTDLLGVPAELIETYGAVSEAVARAMAEGALARSGADLAVAVTGIAGPGGGSAAKPVGLVHLAVAVRGRPTRSRECRFGDIGRGPVRAATVKAALAMVEEALDPVAAAATVRAAHAGDLAGLAAVERSAASLFRGTHLDAAADGETLPGDVLQGCLDAGYLWVAEERDGIVGFLAAEAVGSGLHVLEVSVARAAQGRGVGRALVDAALARARTEGRSAVTLVTDRTLPWNAPFYSRLGFEVLEPPLDPHLAARIEAGREHGFDPGRRCAMRLALTGL